MDTNRVIRNLTPEMLANPAADDELRRVISLASAASPGSAGSTPLARLSPESRPSTGATVDSGSSVEATADPAASTGAIADSAASTGAIADSAASAGATADSVASTAATAGSGSLSPQGSASLSGTAALASDDHDDLVGTILDGRYEIKSLMGRGDISIVYQGCYLASNQVVTVRVLTDCVCRDKQELECFIREARTEGAVRHPSIIPIQSVGFTPSERLYIAVDYVEGKTLESVLAEEGPLPQDEAVKLFVQLCDALSAAHAIGVVHRDLKPSNVILVGKNLDGVKIVDFGVAKLAGTIVGSTGRSSRSKNIVGSPPYMSPEQCDGKLPDSRSDLYSLGCLMYEVLTGKLPFSADTPGDMIRCQLKETPRRLVDVASELGILPALERIVLRALEKVPERRFGSAIIMKNALEKIDLSSVRAADQKRRLDRRRTHNDKAANLPAAGIHVATSKSPGNSPPSGTPASNVAQPHGQPLIGAAESGHSLYSSQPPAQPESGESQAPNASQGPRNIKRLTVIACSLSLLLGVGIANFKSMQLALNVATLKARFHEAQRTSGPASKQAVAQLMQLGDAYWNARAFTKSTPVYRQALSLIICAPPALPFSLDQEMSLIRRAAVDPEQSLVDLGHAYRKSNDTAHATQLLEASIDVPRTQPDLQMRTLLELADMAGARREFPIEQQYLDRAMIAARLIAKSGGSAQVALPQLCMDCAQSEQNLGNFAQAVQWYQQALSCMPQTERADKLRIAGCHRLIASALWQLQREDDGKKNMLTAIDLYRQANPPAQDEIAESYRTLGDRCIKQAKPEEAQNYYALSQSLSSDASSGSNGGQDETGVANATD